MRLGAHDEARRLLDELRRLDPQDRVGGALLSHVLARRDQAAELPAGEALPEYPVRGWNAGAA